MFPEELEDNVSEIFSDEEFTEDLPDNFVDLLDGREGTFNYEDDDDNYSEEGVFDDEGEVDFSKMPPLEEFQDENSR